jgi:hypothetical protein
MFKHMVHKNTSSNSSFVVQLLALILGLCVFFLLKVNDNSSTVLTGFNCLNSSLFFEIPS